MLKVNDVVKEQEGKRARGEKARRRRDHSDDLMLSEVRFSLSRNIWTFHGIFRSEAFPGCPSQTQLAQAKFKSRSTASVPLHRKGARPASSCGIHDRLAALAFATANTTTFADSAVMDSPRDVRPREAIRIRRKAQRPATPFHISAERASNSACARPQFH
jgi:hypothetical protein